MQEATFQEVHTIFYFPLPDQKIFFLQGSEHQQGEQGREFLIADRIELIKKLF